MFKSKFFSFLSIVTSIVLSILAIPSSASDNYFQIQGKIEKGVAYSDVVGGEANHLLTPILDKNANYYPLKSIWVSEESASKPSMIRVLTNLPNYSNVLISSIDSATNNEVYSVRTGTDSMGILDFNNNGKYKDFFNKGKIQIRLGDYSYVFVIVIKNNNYLQIQGKIEKGVAYSDEVGGDAHLPLTPILSKNETHYPIKSIWVSEASASKPSMIRVMTNLPTYTNVLISAIDSATNNEVYSVRTSTNSVGTLDFNDSGKYKDFFNKGKIQIRLGDYLYVFEVVNKIKLSKPPVIYLNGSKIIYLKAGAKYKELGATVKDDVDGASLSLMITPKFNTLKKLKIGKYSVEYSTKDSDGNETKIVRRIIVNKYHK